MIMKFKDSIEGNKTTRTYTLSDGRKYSVPVTGVEYRIACDGLEVPSTHNGKTYIYMWNARTRAHDWYCFENDLSYKVAPWDRG